MNLLFMGVENIKAAIMQFYAWAKLSEYICLTCSDQMPVVSHEVTSEKPSL